MTTRETLWSPAPSVPRRMAATLLRAASRALGQLARQLRRGQRRGPALQPVFEFYAEAGAPEGALYVDGNLVGHLTGVTRL